MLGGIWTAELSHGLTSPRAAMGSDHALQGYCHSQITWLSKWGADQIQVDRKRGRIVNDQGP